MVDICRNIEYWSITCRFAGSLLENLARKHSAKLHDLELKANDSNVYVAIQDKVTPSSVHIDRTILHTLNVYLALMHSDNFRCANRVYLLVVEIWEQLNVHLAATVSDPYFVTSCAQLLDDVILLMTMAALHPAFVFSQRVELFEILTKVQRIRHDVEIIVRLCSVFLLLWLSWNIY